MNAVLQSDFGNFEIIWDKNSSIYSQIIAHISLEEKANNIQDEIFFYQYELDIPFDGTEKEIFEEGDIVYWRSQKEANKFGILFMYGNTTYGSGKNPQTSSPGIKIGTISNYKDLEKIKTGSTLKI
ncbi:MAG: cyclophilin-like family protein [Polaribacter sp.]